MALIKCPECEKEIFDKVKRCPHCGYPMRKTNKIKIVIATIIFLVLVVLLILALKILSKQNNESLNTKNNTQEAINNDANIEATPAIDKVEENYLSAINQFEKEKYEKAKGLFKLNPDYKESAAYLYKLEYKTTYKECTDDALIAVEYLYNNLKNPESLQIHHIYCYGYGYTAGIRDDYMYIDYSGQNGFGGMNREIAYFGSSEYLDTTMAGYSMAIYYYDESKNEIENDIQVYDKGKYSQIVGELDLDVLKEFLPEDLKFCIN